MEQNAYKIANVPRQILILTWKNCLLLRFVKLSLSYSLLISLNFFKSFKYRRNLLGTFLELLCPLIFIAFLLIIRYLIERIKFFNQYNQSNSGNVLDLYVNSINQENMIILFYPNNKLIQELVQDSVRFLKLKNPKFSPESKNQHIHLDRIRNNK